MIGTDKTKLAYYFFGTLIPRLISFTFLPILSFYLSKNELGEYDLFISSISLLVPILTLQLEEAYYRLHFEATKNLVKTVICFSFFSHMLFLVFFMAMYYCQVVQFSLTLLFALFSSSFLLLFQFIARSLNRMSTYCLAAFINSVGIILFTFILYFFKSISINNIAISYIISNLITLFYLILKLKLYKTVFIEYFDYKLIIPLLKFSIPLIPNTISWWMVNIANRYIITLNLGIGFNGSYAVALRLPSLLILLNSIFLLFIQDMVFKNVATINNKIDFSEIFKKYLQFLVTTAIVLITFSKLLVNILFANVYSNTYKLVPIIVIGIILTNLCAFFGIFLLARKQTFKILLSTIFGGILNILFTQFTINHIGLYAPALGTAFGFLFICVIRFLLVKKLQILKLDFKKIIGLLFAFAFACIIFLFNNAYVEVFFMIASVLFFYIINKKLIKQFSSQLIE